MNIFLYVQWAVKWKDKRTMEIKQWKKKRTENTVICNWSDDDERVVSLERPNTMKRQNGKREDFALSNEEKITEMFSFYHFDSLLLLHRTISQRKNENRLIFAWTAFVWNILYRIKLILSLGIAYEQMKTPSNEEKKTSTTGKCSTTPVLERMSIKLLGT